MDNELFVVEVAAPKPTFLIARLDSEDAEALAKNGVKVARFKPAAKPGDPLKKGLALFDLLPEGAEIIGTITLGILGGTAALIGTRVGEWLWPEPPVYEPEEDSPEDEQSE